MGSSHTGSDTAFRFQLEVVPVDPNLVDLTGPEPGNCSNMYVRDVEISICESLGRIVSGCVAVVDDVNAQLVPDP